MPQATAADAKAQAIAQEGYIYLYPMILMDITRKQLTNTNPKINPIGGPANAFTHVRAFPTADMRAVVRPNFDTLYSSAWLDLRDGPLILSTAGSDGRYFLLPMLDMWTDVFAVPGKRTNGTGAASFAIVPRAGTERCPRTSSESIRRLPTYGSSAARKPTARATTKPSINFKTATRLPH